MFFRYCPLMPAARPFCRLSTAPSFITMASSTTSTPTQLLTKVLPLPLPRICRCKPPGGRDQSSTRGSPQKPGQHYHWQKHLSPADAVCCWSIIVGRILMLPRRSGSSACWLQRGQHLPGHSFDLQSMATHQRVQLHPSSPPVM